VGTALTWSGGGHEVAAAAFGTWGGDVAGGRTGEVLEVAAAAASPAQAAVFLQGLEAAQSAIDMCSRLLDRLPDRSQRFFVGHRKVNSSC